MSKKPKISIITATYHRPDLLARCIKSVQNSNFEDYEHLVVSDHCPKARQVYEIFKDDKRIRFLENEPPHYPNHGARAHNHGIEKAESDYICYVTDDNIILPNHLERIYANLSSGNCDVVFLKTHMVRIGRGNGMVRHIVKRDLNKDLYPEKHVPDDLTYIYSKDMSQLGHTKKIIEESGPWKPTHECPGGIEDNEFMQRLEASSKLGVTNEDAYSNIYYIRDSCFVRDEEYHTAVLNLPSDQAFVFPDLLKQTGVV